MLPSPELRPIGVALYRLTGTEPLNLAIASLPLLVIFQRQIISGITLIEIKW